MSTEPSADELAEWLHDLPEKYVDRVRRVSDPGSEPIFEATTVQDGELNVALSEDDPAITIVLRTTTPGTHPSENPTADIEFLQKVGAALIAAPGFTDFVGPDDPMTIDEKPTLVIDHRIYRDGISKHRLLTDILAMIEAGSFAFRMARMIGNLHD